MLDGLENLPIASVLAVSKMHAKVNLHINDKDGTYNEELRQ